MANSHAQALAAVGELGKVHALSPMEAAAYALGFVQGSAPPTLEFWDPHFHIWDLETPAAKDAGYPLASGHDASILAGVVPTALFDVNDYEGLFAGAEAAGTIKHTGGAWVEAVSVCHVDTPSDAPGYAAACLAEASWTAAQLATSDKNYVLVATMPLETPDTKVLLQRLAAVDSRIRGIRQIVNAAPDWPRNGKFEDLLDNGAWQAGYAELSSVGFSFDLQLNPPQFEKAAAVIAKHPETTVIINHLGCPTLEDLEQRGDVFFNGMAKLAAAHDNVYIKISMLCYTDKDWDANPLVTDAVYKVIETFGASRCFFASNYPVDVKDGWPSDKLFAAFRKLASKFDAATQAGLFAGNAKKAYRA